MRPCQRGLGVAMLPDYLVEENGGLVQLFREADTLAMDAYFGYPEAQKSVAMTRLPERMSFWNCAGVPGK